MKIYHVDAFTSKVFGGNPAAIIPLASWLPGALMQQIAMENNLSETAFFVKTDNGYHIRWFTPASEVDLCGHATLASAYVIKNYVAPSVTTITFSTQQAGELKTICKDGMYTLDFPARMPAATANAEAVLQSLGISAAVAVLKSRDYFVVLENEAAVRNLRPDFNLVMQLDGFGLIATARGDSAGVVSRCFYPSAGIPEDPVTGSAHCNIVPYWCQELGVSKLFAKQLSARGGDLWCEQVNGRVLMTGHCAEYMQGVISVQY